MDGTRNSGKIIFALAIALALFSAGCSYRQNPEAENQVLTIYTYDSMVSEYGLGPEVIPLFEDDCNCIVKMVSKGDAGQVLSALMLEKENPKADVVLGLDNTLVYRAVEEGLLEEFTPENSALIEEGISFSPEGYLTPYDYGYFAFVYDSEAVGEGLDSMDSLLQKGLAKKIAVQNPRTSSPGMGLLLWSIAVYGDPGYKEFWKQLKPNLLTVTDGWDESAGLFAIREVPIYLSYATSPPYYAEYEGISTYLAAEFREGHYLQIEGSGIVKGTQKRELAEKFIEFTLTQGFQEKIPLRQFMFPANKNTALPESFSIYALQPEKELSIDSALVNEKQEEWVSEWEKIMLS